MDREGNGVEEAAVGVGREVDGNGGTWGSSTGDLDVQYDLAIRSVGISRWRVARAIHANCHHARRLRPDCREILRDVRWLESPIQFNECDALARAGGVGEFVGATQVGGHVAVERRARLGGRVRHRPQALEVRAGLRSIIETKDAGDDVLQLIGNVDVAGALAKCATGHLRAVE